MTEPQTDAGKALLDELVPEATGHELTCDECRALNHEERDHVGGDIAAIEAEARSQLLAELRAQVEGLNRPPTREEELADCERLGCEDVNHPIQYAERMVKQAAVLSLLEPPR